MKRRLLFLKTSLFLLSVGSNIYATDYFVNNTFTSDDIYTTAAGNDANRGLALATPKLTFAVDYATVLSTIKFYSVLENNKLSIHGRGEFIDSDKVNVSYTITNTTALLPISLNNTVDIFTKQKIYVHDKKLGFYHDLTLSDYFFTEDGSQDRFEILYKLNNTTEDNNTDEVSVIALLQNGLLNIESNTNFSKIELFDTTGKKIFTNETNINSHSFQKSVSIANGVYILNVYCENGIKKSIKIIN
jgi:hypothetical protein